MRESRSLGSVRGAARKGGPYRDTGLGQGHRVVGDGPSDELGIEGRLDSVQLGLECAWVYAEGVSGLGDGPIFGQREDAPDAFHCMLALEGGADPLGEIVDSGRECRGVTRSAAASKRHSEFPGDSRQRGWAGV